MRHKGLTVHKNLRLRIRFPPLLAQASVLLDNGLSRDTHRIRAPDRDEESW